LGQGESFHNFSANAFIALRKQFKNRDPGGVGQGFGEISQFLFSLGEFFFFVESHKQ
jgi:hypothetical protein